MILVLWDASALAKRFIAETGSQTVNALFLAVPVSRDLESLECDASARHCFIIDLMASTDRSSN